MTPIQLTAAGTVTYNVLDGISGLVEQEYNHLFVGKTDSPVHPDPDEVHEAVFASRDELAALHQQKPFSAWFRTVLDHALPEVRRIAPSGRW